MPTTSFWRLLAIWKGRRRRRRPAQACLQGRAGQAELQGRGVGRVADQGVAQGQREPIGGPADRDAEAAAVRGRPPIDDEGVQAGVEDAQAHANGCSVMPCARSAPCAGPRTKASACGLSPWTHSVRTPRSPTSHSAWRTASAGSSTKASGRCAAPASRRAGSGGRRSPRRRSGSGRRRAPPAASRAGRAAAGRTSSAAATTGRA